MIETIAQWAAAVKVRDNHLCQECGSNKRLSAHHIKPRSKAPHLALDLDNGVTLCKMCHAEKHPALSNLIESSNTAKPIDGAHWSDIQVYANNATGKDLRDLRSSKSIGLDYFAIQLGIDSATLLEYESHPEQIIPRVIALAATAVKHRLAPIPNTCRLHEYPVPKNERVIV